MSRPEKSGSKNDFAALFQPEVGETKAQIIGRMDALLDQVHQWVKKGWEHDPKSCPGATMVDGEKRGGWIAPKTWTCSACGFYKNARLEQRKLMELMKKLQELPKGYRYGAGRFG